MGTFPRYWPFVWGIHRSPVNSPHKVQWRGALMFSLICAWINGWVNSREAGDLRPHRTHYDVTVIPGEFNVGLWRIFSTGRLGQCNFVGLSTSFPCFRTKSDCVSNLLALYIVEYINVNKVHAEIMMAHNTDPCSPHISNFVRYTIQYLSIIGNHWRVNISNVLIITHTW